MFPGNNLANRSDRNPGAARGHWLALSYGRLRNSTNFAVQNSGLGQSSPTTPVTQGKPEHGLLAQPPGSCRTSIERFGPTAASGLNTAKSLAAVGSIYWFR